ncbi:hypothetical protein VRB95_11030 [Erwinia aphidicola]|uniref:hypothetical protein n=1 Tax=Erwinia aphidicola TaxID=68334 RepID=UPI0030CD7F3B
MPRVEIIPTTQQHIDELLPHVRQADKDEFWATAMMTADQVLQYGLKHSTGCWTGLADGAVVTIFGVTPASLLTGYGTPWLVASDRLDQYSRAFIRHSRPLLAAMLTRFPRMENYVDARNTAAKQWLHWMGFTIHDPEPAGPFELPFHKFTLEKK